MDNMRMVGAGQLGFLHAVKERFEKMTGEELQALLDEQNKSRVRGYAASSFWDGDTDQGQPGKLK